MRLLAAAVAVALMSAACGPPSDQVLAEQLDVIADDGCETLAWEATSEAISDVPQGGRTHTLAADEDETAGGFGMHTSQRTEEQASEISPVAVIVIARRSSDDSPQAESDLVAHTAKQWVSGVGQAEASSRLIYPRHVLVVAVNEGYVGELQPERLLRAATRDLGMAE